MIYQRFIKKQMYFLSKISLQGNYFILFLFCCCNIQLLFAKETKQDIQERYKIDYSRLDSKYYPYIKSSNKFYDKDIIKIIDKVDKALKKNALFVGMQYGMNMNVSLPFFSSVYTNTKYTQANATLFGLRIGYQKYTGSVLPINTFGYQVYMDLCLSFGRNGLFFNGANLDMLWDFLEITKLIGSLNFGIGIGSAKITGLTVAPTSKDIFEFAYRLNLGISFRTDHHHRIGLYAGSIQGLQTGFFGYTLTIGYDYVF